MKKEILGLSILLFTTVLVSAQSLVITDLESPIIGLPTDDLLTTHATVTNTNTGTDSIQVAVEFNELSVVPGAGHYFCWALCYNEGSVDDGFVTPPNHTLWIVDGESNTSSFSAYYKPHGTAGISVFRFCFFDQNNPSDSTCTQVTFDTQTLGVDGQELTQLVSYPNPADNELTIGYTLGSGDADLRVEVYDMLGTRLSNRKIAGRSGKLILDTEGFPSGMYFYKLIAGDSELSLKKFMVSH